MMMWYEGSWTWGGWVLMTIAMVLFWALLITAVVLLVAQSGLINKTGGLSHDESDRRSPARR